MFVNNERMFSTSFTQPRNEFTLLYSLIPKIAALSAIGASLPSIEVFERHDPGWWQSRPSRPVRSDSDTSQPDIVEA
jgi:hypothetical protein